MGTCRGQKGTVKGEAVTLLRTPQKKAVTKSGTGTWDFGRGDSGTWDVETRGRGDVGTRGLGDVGLGDVGTRGMRGRRNSDTRGDSRT